MGKLKFIACVAIATACPAYAQPQEDTAKLAMQESFSEYDSDGNGELSRAEYASYAQHETSMNQYQAQSRFTAMDANKNGGLSFPEFSGGVCCA